MDLKIEKLVYGGDGLGRTPSEDGRSMAVFVPFVLPGEQVEAEIRQEKPGYARGTVTRVMTESSERVGPNCRYFQQCGGCQYQHIAYARQLEYKAAIARETLQRIAKIELKNEIRVHPSEPLGYRNRTRLRVQVTPEFALGYYRFASHQFLAVSECPISSPLINSVIARLVESRGSGCPGGIEELELFADAADERVLAWAFCGRDADVQSLLVWAEALRAEIPALAGIVFFPSRGRHEDETTEAVPLGHTGETFLHYAAAGASYRASAGAFFQVNRHLIDDLASTVTAGAGGELALDLYAGGGLFSAGLAKIFHHIFAVEASQISHHDLKQNVPTNVKAVRARSEDYLRNRPARKRPDLVVLDPPRAGLGKSVTRALVELAAPSVRYVSCDPATLARDLAPLVASGYRIEEAHLFDLFPQTYHIEMVMLLAR